MKINSETRVRRSARTMLLDFRYSNIQTICFVEMR
jgi:hypothetical protein